MSTKRPNQNRLSSPFRFTSRSISLDPKCEILIYQSNSFGGFWATKGVGYGPVVIAERDRAIKERLDLPWIAVSSTAMTTEGLRG